MSPDLDAVEAHLIAEAKRLDRLAGQWVGTTAGRSSGLYMAASILRQHIIAARSTDTTQGDQ